MKRIALMLTLFTLTSAALGSTEALARGFGRGPMGGGGMGMGMGFGVIRMLDLMDLSEDQERQVSAILKSHREEIAQGMTAAAQAGSALREALHSAEFSEDNVKQAARAMAAQQEQMILLSARIRNEIRTVLTPDQNQRLQELAGKRAGRFHGAVDSGLAALDHWIAEHGE